MINEEDHLRMQALRPGLQLREAWSAIDKFDSALEKKLDYAFNNDLGYLTACPTNLGTGIRVSAMLHLPDSCWPSRSIRSSNPSTSSASRCAGFTAKARSTRKCFPGFKPDDARRNRDDYC